jgi:hypothetical protein
MLGRSFLNLLGTAAVLGALVAAAMPLGLSAVDRTGVPIPCGTAMSPQNGVAAKEDLLNLDQHTLVGPVFTTSDYVGQCAEIIGQRRTIATAVAGGGMLILLTVFAAPYASGLAAALIASRRSRQAEHARPAEPVRHEPDHAPVGAQWVGYQVGAGMTQPILEKTLGEQVGSHDYAAVAAAALRGDGLGNARGAGGGIGQLYAVAGNG